MKSLTGILLAALAAFPAVAQSPDTLEAARQYAQTPGLQKMIEEMSNPANMTQGLLATLPPNVQLTEEQSRRIGEILSTSFASLRPEIERVMIAATAKHFTLEEIQALTAFYQSEHGASVMSKMQPYMQDAMMQLTPQFIAAQQKALPLIIQEIMPK